MRPPTLQPAPILVIEDTLSLQMIYRSVLTQAGHRVVTASSLADGREAWRSQSPSVVLLDLMLPDGDGLDLMQDILSDAPGTAVIVITANGSINRAVEAMRAGAHDFLVKPFDEQRFLSSVNNALKDRAATDRAEDPAPVGDARPASGGMVGSSPALARVHATIRSVARSMATVFITGESGTGKELCALAVHEGSTRSKGPFVTLNCGAIAPDQLESEVFGHVKGAFPGAHSDKAGAASLADGGTLFLDEVCEMPLALQARFMRFVQSSMVHPLGAPNPRKVNVRIVCSTNRDPLDCVRRGQFRDDLYYRLFVIPIHMPALRERGDDVIEIAEGALDCFATEEGRRFDGFDPAVIRLFRSHPWPGNVRQVLNVIRNVVIRNEGGTVTLDMLPAELFRQGDTLPGAAGPLTQVEPDFDSLAGLTMAEIERRVIEAAIARHGGSVPRAARALDLSPSTLYRKLEAWADSASTD